MRSRYAAYAVGAVDYLMGTTDPSGPQHRSPRATWRAELLEFCQQTHFSGLLLLGHGQDGERGWVRFRALLEQGGRDASFEEHSLFHRRDGRWLYHSGRPTAQSGGER